MIDIVIHLDGRGFVRGTRSRGLRNNGLPGSYRHPSKGEDIGRNGGFFVGFSNLL